MKERNNKYKVLIIPGGSGMAIAAIHSLKRDSKIEIVSADADKLSPSLYLADKGYVVPRFDDDSFYPTIYKIVKKEEIDVIIPALDWILLDFSERKKYFEEIGTKVLISDPEILKIARDKWQTYQKLKDIIPLPQSYVNLEDAEIDGMGFPLIIKPRGGSGSSNVYKIESKEELIFFYRRIKDPIIQEFLPGKEYSVDCLANDEGELMVAIPQERISSKGGVATKGKIVKNEFLEEMAEKISSELKFIGPFFFQAKESKDGTPKLTEINPRIGGLMSLASSSGINIHVLAVKMSMGEKISVPKNKINYEIYLTKYFDEIYLTDEIIKNNKIDQYPKKIVEDKNADK